MAKALFGHVGIGNDARLTAEVRRLRTRITLLESELALARAAGDALAASIAAQEALGW